MLWDVFISHAGEDKDDVAPPLSSLLEASGLRIWIDEQTAPDWGLVKSED
jgi:hypothetical protein